MELISINGVNYKIVDDNFNIFDVSEISEMLTEYFLSYDYILGDQSYNKIRLKGFYESNNKNCTSINNINDLDAYLKNYCAYGCKWFLLKKMQ